MGGMVRQVQQGCSLEAHRQGGLLRQPLRRVPTPETLGLFGPTGSAIRPCLAAASHRYSPAK